MSLSTAITVLQEFEAFSQATQTDDIGRFAIWLHKKYNGALSNEQSSADEVTNREIAYFLGRMNRYSRHYAKVAFDGLPISTIEEFWFLNVAFHKKNPAKMEVYEATITELATGTQMMRRLVELGLLKEEQDSDDKRVRRVKLTKEGKTIRNEALERLGVEVRLKMGNLAISDKERLLEMLRYLDTFHHRIYQEAGEKTLAEMVEEYCC
ncbi:MAG: MarR family transcriptional regulator [Candidatus Kapabacteria bacterium]|nr:MarR family transcriptional regulator [Candidatus Kapabacteria bacterium]